MAQKQDLDRMCPVGQEAALGTKLDALITLANELRTDHGTNRTFQGGDTHGKQAGFSGRCDNSGSGYSVDIIMGRVPVH